MTINSYDEWVSALTNSSQYFPIVKDSYANTAVALMSLIARAGTCQGVLAGTDTAAGVVPTSATAGAVPLVAFGSGNSGYIATVGFYTSVACKLYLYDMVFKAGAYAFNANVTLASQPSYASRAPLNDYAGFQIFLEVVTAFTGTGTITVTYTNQAGTTGRTSTLALPSAPALGRVLPLPFQTGDSGVRKIESVVMTGISAGTFNILVQRLLWTGRAPLANSSDNHDLNTTGAPSVFTDSCIVPMVRPDSTSTGVIEIEVRVVNG
jgi:hypothetical protein